MKLSRKSHDLLESFFREYFDDAKLKLPEIEVYAKRGARLVTKILGVNGITFGRRVFIKPNLLKRVNERNFVVSKELLAHEATHVVQYQKLGFFKFLQTYLQEFFAAFLRKNKWNFNSRFEAYWEISQEIEARRCAAEFIEWRTKTENGK